MTRPIAPGITLVGVEFVAARRARRLRTPAPAPTVAEVVARSTSFGDDPVAAIARASGMPAHDVREALLAGRTEADLLAVFGRVRRSA